MQATDRKTANDNIILQGIPEKVRNMYYRLYKRKNFINSSKMLSP